MADHRAPLVTVVTFGTYDVFHIGHLNLLERARQLGNRLVVGVSSDALNVSKKGRPPVFGQEERIAIVGALRCVDSTFLEHSLEDKPNYLRCHDADVLVMGDDWEGKFDHLSGICRVVYLPRTPSVSTTATIERITRLTPL